MNSLFKPDDEIIRKIHEQFNYSQEINPPFLPTLVSLTAQEIATLVEVAFWASLQTEESRETRVTIRVVNQDTNTSIRTFELVKYSEINVVKLSPAVPSGHCLAVCKTDSGLQICGISSKTSISFADFDIEIERPGRIHVGIGPFKRYAVLDGRSNSIIAASGIELSSYLRRLLGKALPTEDFWETQAVGNESRALATLAGIVLADGHGGTILVVPNEEGNWNKSLSSFEHRFAQPDTSIPNLIRRMFANGVVGAEVLASIHELNVSNENKEKMLTQLSSKQSFDLVPMVEETAALARVDGAVVLTKDIIILGFAAKIKVAGESNPHVCIIHAGEVEHGTMSTSPLTAAGGMRHQSAAIFVEQNRDSVAIVISQDRHMSVMNWDTKLDAVIIMRDAELLKS